MLLPSMIVNDYKKITETLLPPAQLFRGQFQKSNDLSPICTICDGGAIDTDVGVDQFRTKHEKGLLLISTSRNKEDMKAKSSEKTPEQTSKRITMQTKLQFFFRYM